MDFEEEERQSNADQGETKELNAGSKEAGSKKAGSKEAVWFDAQCWLSDALDPSSCADLPVVNLTPDHKKVIVDTWPLISQSLHDNGVEVFERIFEVSPKIRSVFGASFGFPEQPIPDAYDLSQAERLQDHVKRFMGAVEWSVQHLDDEMLLKTMCTNLGRHHIHLQSLQKDFFSVFAGALMYVWRTIIGRELFTSQVRNAWNRLFELLLQYLAHGYGEALKEIAL